MTTEPANQTDGAPARAPGEGAGGSGATTTGSALGRAIGAGLVAAIVGGVVWGLIVRATDYEVGFVAWGVGFLVGTAVALAARQGSGPTFGVIAVVLSLIGILLGKYLSFAWVLSAEGVELSLFSSATVDAFIAAKDIMFSGMDLLFVALAVFSAWSIVNSRLNSEPDAAPASAQ